MLKQEPQMSKKKNRMTLLMFSGDACGVVNTEYTTQIVHTVRHGVVLHAYNCWQRYIAMLWSANPPNAYRKCSESFGSSVVSCLAHMR